MVEMQRSERDDNGASSSNPIGSELVAWLRSRAPDIEDTVLARFRDSELGDALGVEVTAELRPAVVEAVNFVLAATEEGESWSPTVPPTTAAHIRSFARQGASLEGILRGYAIVVNSFFEFFAEELAEFPRAQEALRYAVRVQRQHSDRLMSAFAAVYDDEIKQVGRSPSQQLEIGVRRLLAGEAAEPVDLGYDLDAWHVGLIGVGRKSGLASRSFAERLGCNVLLVPQVADTTWVWLGAKQSISFDKLSQAVQSGLGESLRFAVGEARKGVDGWRLTHQEAQLALEVMIRGSRQRLTRCSNVVLLAAVMRDETIARFLADVYVKPLRECADGVVLCQTLRAYFAVNGNIASAAASLGVDRHTVRRRLRKAEKAIDRPVDACRPELDVALRLESLA